MGIGMVEAVVAQGHKGVTVTRRLWIRCPLKEIKYLFKFIFLFLRSGVETKSGIEFRHSTRNVSKIRRQMGNSAV